MKKIALVCILATAMVFGGCGRKVDVSTSWETHDSDSKVETNDIAEDDTKNEESTTNKFYGEEKSNIPENAIKAGHYKVGVDIQPGLYMCFVESIHGYYCIASDANGDDIIANDNFSTNDMFQISEGQYLELSGAYALKFEEAPTSFVENGVLPQGFYLVGTHIAPGEYKIKSLDGVHAYYGLYSDANQRNIISNDNFETERYITISAGQYLELSGCELIVPQQ